MGSITTRDGTRIHFKDWGEGRPVVFSHPWPLNADVWDEQLFLLASEGFRAIAHDRRGHGRSDQSWSGNDMDTHADDLAALIEALSLEDAVLVGHATGGGEVTRYVARHGTSRVSGVVLVSAIPPLVLKTPRNPGGTPVEIFERLRHGLTRDRAQLYRDLSAPYYGANRPGTRVSQCVLDAFWSMAMSTGLKGAYDGIRVLSETDLTGDLGHIDIPALIIHGDEDQVVPIGASALRAAKMIKNAALEIYAGGPHGLTVTHRDRFHADLLEFLHN